MHIPKPSEIKVAPRPADIKIEQSPALIAWLEDNQITES